MLKWLKKIFARKEVEESSVQEIFETSQVLEDDAEEFESQEMFLNREMSLYKEPHWLWEIEEDGPKTSLKRKRAKVKSKVKVKVKVRDKSKNKSKSRQKSKTAKKPQSKKGK